MLKNNINLLKNEKGAAAVETAIILGLLLIFIFGIIEFSLLLFNKHLLTNASREGARAGIVVGLDRTNVDDSDYYLTESKKVASDYCAEYLVNFEPVALNPPSVSFTDVDGNGSPTRGDDLTVSLTYDYHFLLLSAFGIIDKITLNAVSIMKLE